MKTANDDIPHDEMVLAILIGEVKSRGWAACRRAHYRDSMGMRSSDLLNCPLPSTTSCCVQGAARLLGIDLPLGAITGNDRGVFPNDDLDLDEGDGYTLGQSFYAACRP